ncbi:MAG: PhzF family phenazine biosynthesis protein [Bacteroidetes bacterium]|nr:PhzF family phenazine biosynthesis protein [Bacteroidota bacterium]
MRKYFHVNSFTTQPLRGNPSGVVLNGEKLSDEDMQLIARDINLPETVFVLPGTSEKSVCSLRWFTPTSEISLSGHSTLAAIHVLIRERILPVVDGFVNHHHLDYQKGILPFSVEPPAGGAPTVWIGLPVPVFKPFGGPQEDIFRHLGITDNDIDSRLPIYITDTKFLMIPVLGLLTVKKILPNYGLLRKVLQEESISGVLTFSRETVKPASNFHSRFFSPGLGINEDPVTGITNASLAAYWLNYILPSPENRTYEFIGEQGFSIRRDGEVTVRALVQDRAISRLEISGPVRVFLQGYLEF